jgi:hypothetical protein
MSWETRLLSIPALVKDRRTLALVLPFCEELIRRQDHPFYHYTPDDHPTGNQLAFHESQAAIRLVFGGNQSGKSKAVAHEISWWLTDSHPYQVTPTPCRIYVLSASYRTIQEGVYRHLKEITPEWMIEDVGPNIAGWQLPSFILMKTGTRVDFLSGEGREDARRKVQAAEIDFAVVDEEIDETIWTELQARRLAREGRVVVAATLVRSEPWCLDLEDRGETGDENIHITRLSTYRARDRGHVSANVVKEMEDYLTEQERQVRLAGQSRRFEGLVYPAFSRAHVCEPFDIPKEWTRYCALDPGWRVFGVLWVAVAPDGKYVIYRQHYVTAKHYKEIAAAIYAAEGYQRIPDSDRWAPGPAAEQIQIRWIDPSAYGHHETGELRIGSLLAMDPYNLYCAPARNDVEAGIEMCARSLMEGIDGVPKCRVFSTCVDFLREIRGYRRAKDNAAHDKNERKDAPIKRADHLLDCWRYLELGGLHYIPEPDPRFRPRTDHGSRLPFKVQPTMQVAMQKEWDRLMRKQVNQHEQPAHPGGLGSEY